MLDPGVGTPTRTLKHATRADGAQEEGGYHSNLGSRRTGALFSRGEKGEIESPHERRGPPYLIAANPAQLCRDDKKPGGEPDDVLDTALRRRWGRCVSASAFPSARPPCNLPSPRLDRVGVAGMGLCFRVLLRGGPVCRALCCAPAFSLRQGPGSSCLVPLLETGESDLQAPVESAGSRRWGHWNLCALHPRAVVCYIDHDGSLPESAPCTERDSYFCCQELLSA